MTNAQLPERVSLEYLKKLAKDRLRELRRTSPETKLADALLAVARDHGFSSWRALKAEVEERQKQQANRFFDACRNGDIDHLRVFLADDSNLANAGMPDARYGGWTGLHEAAKHGRSDAMRLLLDHGADPNAREAGDNTCPLHWAAAHANVQAVRVLLDAGADVHGFGDVHKSDVIGWAASSIRPGDSAEPDDERLQVISLLVDRGAHHHIFSAIAVGDLGLIRRLVEDNPDALDRRMSQFEGGQTPLHFSISRKRYDILALLIEIGADLEAENSNRQTAMAVAMLHGDREAMTRLKAAGAKPPKSMADAGSSARMAKMAESIEKGVPMIYVPDVAQALAWYTSIGFKEVARYDDAGLVNFGMVSFGRAELMLNMHGKPGKHDVSLWFYTDRVDDIYEVLKGRQLQAAEALLAGTSDGQAAIEFVQDLEDMFYGARQFSVRDPNGYELYFIQSAGT